MSAKYYTILTEVGKTKVANAAALGRQIKLTQLAVGDGAGTEYDPVESQTSLKKETYRTPISHLGTDAQNPNWVIAEGMIPVDVGGWFVREVALFDEDGDLFAIGKYPETYKPTLAEGTGRDLYIRFIMVVSNTETIDMKIDPTVAIATRTWTQDQVGEVAGSLAGGNYWPLYKEAVEVGDEIPDGPKFLRVSGGAFSKPEIVGLVDLDGNSVMPSGVVQAESLSVAPYSLKIDGTWYRLTNLRYMDELSDTVDPKFVFSDRATTFDKRQEALQITVNYAVLTGRRYVRIDENYDDVALNENRANVIFVGRGSLNSVYRKEVMEPNAPTFRFFNDLSNVSLRNFRAKKAPVVVFLGDSTYTIQPDVRSRTETVQSMITNALVRKYPEKNISFHNRAIGGQTWTTANDKPSRTIWWYTDPDKPWLDYVKELDPDLVVIGFGMNDSKSFKASDMRSVIGKLQSIETPPDILIGTNLVPSIGTPQSDFNSKAAQEGRDFVAGYMRSFAIANDIPFLDFNRYENIVRDGRDVMTTAIHRDGFQDSSEIVNGHWTYGRELNDFAVEVYIHSTDPQHNLDIYNGVHGQFYMKLGPDREDVVFFDNDNGKVRLRFFSGGQNYKTITTSQDIPTGLIRFYVEKSGTTFTYRADTLDEHLDLVRIDDLITHGGLFQPKVGYYLKSDGPLTPAWLTTNYGVPTKYMPTLFDDEIWGGASSEVETSLEGGNGVNHPSSYGAKMIYGPVIDAADWCRPYRAVKDPEWLSGNVGIYTPITLFVDDNSVRLAGNISLNGETTLFQVPPDARSGTEILYFQCTASTADAFSSVTLKMSSSGYVSIAPGQPTPDALWLNDCGYAIK